MLSTILKKSVLYSAVLAVGFGALEANYAFAKNKKPMDITPQHTIVIDDDGVSVYDDELIIDNRDRRDRRGRDNVIEDEYELAHYSGGMKFRGVRRLVRNLKKSGCSDIHVEKITSKYAYVEARCFRRYKSVYKINKYSGNVISLKKYNLRRKYYKFPKPIYKPLRSRHRDWDRRGRWLRDIDNGFGFWIRFNNR